MAPTLHVGDLTPYLTAYNIASFSVGLTVLYFIGRCIYNVYFHPLSKYPGPKLAAASWLPFYRSWFSGQHPRIIKGLHDKYGPVVRTGPNQLSYCSATSWKDIYGHVGGRKPFMKSDFYDDDTPKSIVSSRDPHQHGKMRRNLSNGFSAKALVEQEAPVQQYVDKFISQLNVYATGKEGDEVVKWYNFTTFDIIGDLAFGDPFGSLDDGKPHFWVKTVLDSVKAGSFITMLNKNPILKALIPMLISKKDMDARKKHHEYSRGKVIKRMESTTSRKDLISGLVMKQKSKEEGITVDEMMSQAGLLIVAGSETTATLLSGITFHLCRNPTVYQKLVKEIRGAFSSYDDIDGLATEHLTYLKATLDEGLRIYPPVPFGLPRVSPGETVDGAYVPKGTEVSTTAWAATHSEENFHRPFDFLPERWIDPDCTDKKAASQPFSLGTRVCLGRSLALMEMRIIMAKMLWVYDMELVNPESDWIGGNLCYSLWHKPELRVRYTRRSGITVPLLD